MKYEKVMELLRQNHNNNKMVHPPLIGSEVIEVIVIQGRIQKFYLGGSPTC